MRSREPGLITGRALRLTVPLGWHSGAHKLSGRVGQALGCWASGEFGAGEWRVGEA